MPVDVTTNELINQNNTAASIQPGGPGTQRYLTGSGTTHTFIEGASIATGDVETRYVPSTSQPGQWKRVSSSRGVPGNNTVDLSFMERWRAAVRSLYSRNCAFNVYELHGRCADLSSLLTGNEGYVMTYAGLQVSGDIDLGTRSSPDSSDPLAISVSTVAQSIYPQIGLSFGTEADNSITTPVTDLTYGASVQCAECGLSNDGSQVIYAAISGSTSPAVVRSLRWTNDGGKTWNISAVTHPDLVAADVTITWVRVVGNLLMLAISGVNGYFVTTINADTAAPGTVYTRVNAAPAVPFIDAAIGAGSTIFLTDGSGIYTTTSPLVVPVLIQTYGASFISRIAANSGVVAVCGNNSFVAYSQNNGISWTTANTAALPTTPFTAIDVIGDRTFIVGAAPVGVGPTIYITRDRGNTWQAQAMAAVDTSAVDVVDIKAATAESLWVLLSDMSLNFTVDGGFEWGSQATQSWRVQNYINLASPTKVGVRLGIPQFGGDAIKANNVAIAGRPSGTPVDGILLVATPYVE